MKLSVLEIGYLQKKEWGKENDTFGERPLSQMKVNLEFERKG